MKLTLSNVRKISKESDNRLVKRVCGWVATHWRDYNKKENIFTDVLNYGCRSGAVSELIYWSDTTPFYKKYQDEINLLVQDVLNGMTLNQLFPDWDNDDPLAHEDHNKCLLAWFGFESTLLRIGLEFDSVATLY